MVLGREKLLAKRFAKCDRDGSDSGGATLLSRVGSSGVRPLEELLAGQNLLFSCVFLMEKGQVSDAHY